MLEIEVPIDSAEYFINSVGCLRYSQMEGRKSSCIEPLEIGVYLSRHSHFIVKDFERDGKKYVLVKEKLCED